MDDQPENKTGSKKEIIEQKLKMENQ